MDVEFKLTRTASLAVKRGKEVLESIQQREAQRALSASASAGQASLVRRRDQITVVEQSRGGIVRLEQRQ
jgi:hypothetical protein